MKKILYSVILTLIICSTFASCTEEQINPSADGGTTEAKKF